MIDRSLGSGLLNTPVEEEIINCSLFFDEHEGQSVYRLQGKVRIRRVLEHLRLKEKGRRKRSNDDSDSLRTRNGYKWKRPTTKVKGYKWVYTVIGKFFKGDVVGVQFCRLPHLKMTPPQSCVRTICRT